MRKELTSIVFNSSQFEQHGTVQTLEMNDIYHVIKSIKFIELDWKYVTPISFSLPSSVTSNSDKQNRMTHSLLSFCHAYNLSPMVFVN